MKKIIELERLNLEYAASIKSLSNSENPLAVKELRLLTLKRMNVKNQLLDEYRKLYRKSV